MLAYGKKTPVSFVLLVRPPVCQTAWLSAAASGRISVKCGIGNFLYKKSVKKIQNLFKIGHKYREVYMKF